MRCSSSIAAVSLLAVTSSAAWGISGAPEATGTPFVEVARLTNPELEPEAWFGAMAISGDTIVVGAHGDDHSGLTDAGSAHVFVATGGTWALRQSLTAPDAAAFDHFGGSLAVWGDTMVVGSVWNDSPVHSVGAVYVFSRTGGEWAFQQKLPFSDPVESDRCSVGLDICEDTIAVGCTDGPGGGGGSPGKVYVFTRTGSVWTEQALFTAPDVGSNDYFGTPVAVVRDTLVAGSRGHNPLGVTIAGAAYVYSRTGDTWSFEQKITASDAGEGDNFGSPLDFDGQTLVVGAPYDDHSEHTDAGSSYVFAKVGGVWTERQKLTAGTPLDHDCYGWSAAAWGDAVLIGTSGSFRNPNTWETTAVDFFTRSDQTFERRQTVFGGDLGCLIAWNVAMEGDLALVSGCDPSLGLAAVHVFSRTLFSDSFESGDTLAWTVTIP